MRGVALLAVAVAILAGCAEEPAQQSPATGLAALGLVPVTTPFDEPGTTLCLPGEGGDDVACEPGTSARLLLGPYDAPILEVAVTLEWSGSTPLMMTLLCHEHGTSASPPRCEGTDDLEVTGTSPLHANLTGMITPPTAVVEVQVEVPDGVGGLRTPTRQEFRWMGTLVTARDPDATNQA